MQEDEKIQAKCKVETSPLARQDLEEIFLFIAENNEEAAVKFFNDLAAKFRTLSENPKIGSLKKSYFVELRSFPYKNYVIFYFPIENGVEIYRVLHGARNIDELFDEYIEGLKP